MRNGKRGRYTLEFKLRAYLLKYLLVSLILKCVLQDVVVISPAAMVVRLAISPAIICT